MNPRTRSSSAALAIVLAMVFAGQPARASSKVIFEKDSPYTKVRVTEDERGIRSLTFGQTDVLQTQSNPTDPDYLPITYIPCMVAGLALVDRPARVLIVGLGGGALPRLLQKHLPELDIDVVDIDPVVVQAAKDYFGVRETEHLHLHVDDGRRFIAQAKQPYDVIFLDAYGSQDIPYRLATVEFLRSVRGAVTARGVVVANIWERGSNPLHDSMVATYQSVFPQVQVMAVPGWGNEIVLAVPRPAEKPPVDLVSRATALAQQRRLGFDLGALVKAGLRDLPSTEHGDPLRDQKPE